MIITDGKTYEMYKIIINICLEICKKHVLRQKGFDEKRSKLQKKIQRSTNHQTKENVINHIKEIEQQIKNLNKYGKKSKRNESYCCYQEKPKILL